MICLICETTKDLLTPSICANCNKQLETERWLVALETSQKRGYQGLDNPKLKSAYHPYHYQRTK